MPEPATVILGIPIPSTSPLFLSVLLVHVIAGLGCVLSGLVAMLSEKKVGQHPTSGAIYFWCLVVVTVSMATLSIMRWPADTHLMILGLLSFVAGTVGRAARRGVWRRWVLWHIPGMGASYILLLTAFYVDNGPNLPFWRSLPTAALWWGPSLIGLPLIVWALVHHPLAQRSRPRP